MIDRHSLMTSFLQYTYKYKNENPNHFNITTIYNFLSTYGLYKEEVKFPYDENYFTYFKEYYRNNPNIRVDEDNKNKNNLLITNINNIDDFNFIKIYLNPSKDSYFNLTTKLLTFLSANPDIKHYSDFSKECRSDQVILRVRKIEDVKKIINFINNDLTIVNNLRYPNPFLHWDKMVGFAFDKELSFNSAISYVINEYLETKHDINAINSDDFVYFVKTFYNNLISNNSFDDYANFISSFMFSNSLKEMKINNPGIDINNVLSDYLYLFEQFFKLYDEEDSLDLYSQLYDYSKSSEESKKRHSFLKRKYDLYLAKRDIDDYIKYAYAKYNDPEEVSHRLSECAKAKISGLDFAVNYITRDKGFRERFLSVTADQIYTVTNNDIYTYVDSVLKIDYSNDYEAERSAS